MQPCLVRAGLKRTSQRNLDRSEGDAENSCSDILGLNLSVVRSPSLFRAAALRSRHSALKSSTRPKTYSFPTFASQSVGSSHYGHQLCTASPISMMSRSRMSRMTKHYSTSQSGRGSHTSTSVEPGGAAPPVASRSWMGSLTSRPGTRSSKGLQTRLGRVHAPCVPDKGSRRRGYPAAP